MTDEECPCPDLKQKDCFPGEEFRRPRLAPQGSLGLVRQLRQAQKVVTRVRVPKAPQLLVLAARLVSQKLAQPKIRPIRPLLPWQPA
jgi:hypothetical protein